MAFHVDISAAEFHTPSKTSIALRIFIGLLIIDSVVEISFVSSSLAWLKTVHHKIYHFDAYGSRHRLSGLPRYFLLDQAYTTNGAAITTLIVVCLGGIVSLWLRNWAQYRTGEVARLCRYFYYLWLSFNVPALFLAGAALVYIFAVTNAQEGQRIDKAQAIALNGRPYFPDTWTPQSWFSAVLRLKGVRGREEIARNLAVMRGWQYNIILMFLLQFGETVLAFVDYNLWVRKPSLPEAHHGF